MLFDASLAAGGKDMTISRRAAARLVFAGLVLLACAAARAQVAAPARWAATEVKTPKSSPIPMPTAPADAWTAILENVRDNGKYVEGDETFPARFSLEDVRGSTAAAHTEDEVSVLGAVAEDDGLFHPLFAEIVSENWTIDAKGDWRIEQWMFLVRIDGSARDGMHNILHETPDRHVLGEEKLGISDGGQAHFDALIERWTKYVAPK